MHPFANLSLSSDIIARTKWYVHVRWFLLTALAVPGVVSLYIVDGWSSQVQRDFILGLVAVLSNGIFYLVSRMIRKETSFKTLAKSLVIFDVFLATLLIFINGGIESRNPILYVIPILISAAIFGRRGIYKATLASIVMYDFVIIADYFNIIHSVGAFDPTLRSWFSYVVSTVTFFTAVLIIIAIVVDFITSLLTEKERQASQNLAALKEAQSIAKFGSWEWDLKKDKVYWSDELRNIFGINSKDGTVNYENYIKALHPEDRAIADNIIKKALKNKKSFSFDHRIVRPNGVVRYLHGNGRPITDENGKIIKLIGTAQDITEARILEEARNDFVALASHQLRTPATGVKQYLGLLLDGYAGSLSDDQKSFVRIAYESNDRQLNIVDDLLNVAQVDSGNIKLRKQKTNLATVVEKIIKDQELKFKNKQQTLTFETKYKRIYAELDERRLRMAIENILDNSHKYTEAKGHTKVSLTKEGKNALLTITDDGTGIAKKDISQIFKKFSRAPTQPLNITDGTGLGLYLAKRIVNLHGGRIAVESAIGKGTKFKIYLPQSKIK